MMNDPFENLVKNLDVEEELKAEHWVAGKTTEIERRFTFQRITPELVYDMMGHTPRASFESQPSAVRERCASLAKSIRDRASLCADCGTQAPLGWDGICATCRAEEQE